MRIIILLLLLSGAAWTQSLSAADSVRAIAMAANGDRVVQKCAAEANSILAEAIMKRLGLQDNTTASKMLKASKFQRSSWKNDDSGLHMENMSAENLVYERLKIIYLSLEEKEVDKTKPSDSASKRDFGGNW